MECSSEKLDLKAKRNEVFETCFWKMLAVAVTRARGGGVGPCLKWDETVSPLYEWKVVQELARAPWRVLRSR